VLYIRAFCTQHAWTVTVQNVCCNNNLVIDCVLRPINDAGL